MDHSSDVDERTLREIYLPAFEAVVKEAHVGAIMDAYKPGERRVHDQNSHLNKDIVKKEWGFDGIIMSDWGATHDGVAAANGWVDLAVLSGMAGTLKEGQPGLSDIIKPRPRSMVRPTGLICTVCYATATTGSGIPGDLLASEYV